MTMMTGFHPKKAIHHAKKRSSKQDKLKVLQKMYKRKSNSRGGFNGRLHYGQDFGRMTRDNFQDQTKVLAQSNAFQPGVGGRRGMHHQEFAGEIYAG